MFQRYLLPLSSQQLMMEAARTSEMLVHFYQTTWHYNPEDSHLLLDTLAKRKIPSPARK
jgi:hypothetical protein